MCLLSASLCVKMCPKVSLSLPPLSIFLPFQMSGSMFISKSSAEPPPPFSNCRFWHVSATCSKICFLPQPVRMCLQTCPNISRNVSPNVSQHVPMCPVPMCPNVSQHVCPPPCPIKDFMFSKTCLVSQRVPTCPNVSVGCPHCLPFLLTPPPPPLSPIVDFGMFQQGVPRPIFIPTCPNVSPCPNVSQCVCWLPHCLPFPDPSPPFSDCRFWYVSARCSKTYFCPNVSQRVPTCLFAPSLPAFCPFLCSKVLQDLFLFQRVPNVSPENVYVLHCVPCSKH